MNELIAHVLDEIKSAARFRWAAVAVAWALCVLGWLLVFYLPDRYESTARIFVDTKTALTPVLQGLAIQQDDSSQLNYVYQSLSATPQLEKIARETGLDQIAKTADEKAKLIESLRKRISVNIANGANSGAVFTIAYQDQSKDRSLKVVSSLLKDFVENTLGGKQVDSETAQKFLTDQIADYERRLRAAEEGLADFKKKNVGLMPGEQGDYFGKMQKEIDAKKNVEGLLAVAQTRREELAHQLRGEAPAVLVSQPNQNSASGTGGDTSERIKESESKIDQLLLRFTDKHPDVIALKETIAQLKQRRAAEIEALRRGDLGAAVESGATANPIYQSIQLALNQADVEIASLRGQLNNHDRQIADLRKLVNTVPEVEAEYARLNRDYNVTRAQYTALVERFERAKLGDEAQASGSVRFKIVDPPRTATQPVAPKRQLMTLLVLCFGLGGGAALAYGLHLLKPVFNSSRSVHDATGLPVLGVVSLTWLNQRRHQLIRSYLSCAFLAALLLIVFVGVFVFNQSGAMLLQKLIS